MNIKSALKNLGGVLQQNSPYILTGLGAAGVVSTAILTGKATIKAKRIVDNYEHEIELKSEDLQNQYWSHPWMERVKLCWKAYLPPVLMGATTVGCIIGAQSINSKRSAALAGLYSLTEATLKDYQQKVVEQIGETKEEKIRGEVAQKRLDENPVSKAEVIVTERGNTLFFDSTSGRYFKSDIETLRRIQNDFNHELMGQMWVRLNDLYCVIGLEPIKIGDDVGWTVDELIEFKFLPKITDTGEPCIVLDYDVTPRFLKGSLWD